jgi:hypothetical protein
MAQMFSQLVVSNSTQWVRREHTVMDSEEVRVETPQ